jgi:hypothetical protein
MPSEEERHHEPDDKQHRRDRSDDEADQAARPLALRPDQRQQRRRDEGDVADDYVREKRECQRQRCGRAMPPGIERDGGEPERPGEEMQREKLGVESGASPGRRAVAQPVPVEVSPRARCKHEKRRETCGSGRESEEPRTAIDAGREEDEEQVVKRRECGSGTRECFSGSRPDSGEEVGQRLIAPP